MNVHFVKDLNPGRDGPPPAAQGLASAFPHFGGGEERAGILCLALVWRPANKLKNKTLTPNPFPRKNGEGERKNPLVNAAVLSPYPGRKGGTGPGSPLPGRTRMNLNFLKIL